MGVVCGVFLRLGRGGGVKGAEGSKHFNMGMKGGARAGRGRWGGEWDHICKRRMLGLGWQGGGWIQGEQHT